MAIHISICVCELCVCFAIGDGLRKQRKKSTALQVWRTNGPEVTHYSGVHEWCLSNSHPDEWMGLPLAFLGEAARRRGGLEAATVVRVLAVAACVVAHADRPRG